MDKSSSVTGGGRDLSLSCDSEDDDGNPLIGRKTRTANANTTSQPAKPPAVQNTDRPAAAVDINNWCHDARALDKKFDDLIAKLDALIFELDCILGSVSPSDAIKKLTEECKNHSKLMSSTKRSLVGIQGTIRGAYAVCERLPKGETRDRLLDCAKRAEDALKSFAMQSTPPRIRSLDAGKNAHKNEESSSRVESTTESE